MHRERAIANEYWEQTITIKKPEATDLTLERIEEKFVFSLRLMSMGHSSS